MPHCRRMNAYSGQEIARAEEPHKQGQRVDRHDDRGNALGQPFARIVMRTDDGTFRAYSHRARATGPRREPGKLHAD